jgi:hypothetical protein
VKQFKAGTRAQYDAFTQIIPVKVLEVIEPGNGRICGSGRLKMEVISKGCMYPKGTILERNCYHTFPTEMRMKRKYTFRINPNYEWIK